MDYEEEQSNELIVLESIYCDELTIISDSPHEFEVSIKYSDIEGNHTEKPPSIVLSCKFPEKYPDEEPILAIEKWLNLPDSEVDRLKEHLDDLATKNLGTVMIYTLIAAAQEWLNDYEDNNKKEAALEHEKKKQIEADLERKKFEGTIVTKETFIKWKTDFDAERNVFKSNEVVDKVKKLTGRELFMKDNTLNESDLKFLEEDGEVVKVNETLFQDLDNLEIE